MLQLKNIGLLSTYNSTTESFESIKNCNIDIENDIIIDIGENKNNGDHMIDCNQKLVTPGFVDAHTHPVFKNGREKEFIQRISGKSYEEIAAEGGGINSSIIGVRESTEIEILDHVKKRMDEFLSMGTTTIEAKTGYGLDIESELKSLRVLDHVHNNHKIDIFPTFLGAHSIPDEFNGDSNAYVDLLCNEMIPAVSEQGIAKFCDVFCEEGYFDLKESRKILKTAIKYDLVPRIHADEFSNIGGSKLASEVKAISADHLMEISDEDIELLSNSDTIAILLPGTTFFLGKEKYAPARKLIDRGAHIAIASDFNPGSCHIKSMPFIIGLSCIYLGLSIEEALKAATWSGACAINEEERIGSIEVGKKADLIIWDLDTIEQIPYNITSTPIRNVIKDGDPLISLD
ncbi:MAG: imidazolonepropionase [Candidatus Neomarinimicrobiota bacterium]|nr:imidazolonepropionase [Candidatus Neomarinimicrobiota bacterium]MEC9274266.1 imidazolonepropionase [Candidatus Neomarinimicrobiota bacterium]